MVESELSDGVVVLRLNAPPMNTITLELLSELGAAIRQANEDPAIQGIVLTGAPDHFSAGADVDLFRQIQGADDAVRLSQVFQNAFQEIEDAPKPVVVALTGRVLGGALELAMACHVRVAGTNSQFMMPEVRLGINPGAGGTQRLPRLVGPATALRMMLTAETIDAETARQRGLVDVVCPNDHVIQRAREMALATSEIRRTSRQTDRVKDTAEREAAYQMAEGLLADARPEIIAPWKIMEAVRTGLEESFEAGLVKEQEVCAECFQTRATQNKIYLFFATRQTSKIPELAAEKPDPIATAAVIGTGSMGTDITIALILAGVPVVALDQNETALAQATEKMNSFVQKRVAQGKLSRARAETAMASLSTTRDWEDVAQADLVIESVIEDVEVKRSAIHQVETVCRCGTILASNTSTIDLDELAKEMRYPERLIGMHFFNPAHRMPLVEIVRRDTTPPAILAAAIRLAKSLRKTPVLVASRPGFLVTRLFVPYVQEAFWMLEEGAAAEAIDEASVAFGFPMGPFVLMDMTGLDILAHSQRVLASALPRHGNLSEIAVRLVEQGHLGQKTGVGIYQYEPGSHVPQPCDTTAQIIAGVQRECGRTPRDVPAEEITERLVLRMVSEAFYVMEEGIARIESDVDVAMVLGTGFPDFRGGVLRYANDLGFDRVLARLDELAGRLGERFSPCQLLRKMEGGS